MKKYILPNPFHQGPYGTQTIPSYRRVVSMNGANDNAAIINTSNELTCCKILDEVTYTNHPNNSPEIGYYLDTCSSMQKNAADIIEKIWPTTDRLFIFGGDHSISIGTGTGLSRVVDMKKVGLLYIDTHTDINTPETSNSKSITGYPVAVNLGEGPEKLVSQYQGNFIEKVAFIGIRDVDKKELEVVKRHDTKVYSSLDVEEFGIAHCTNKSLEFLKDCEYIWLSVDVDVLEQTYFEKGETDEPAPGGLTLRELLTIANICRKSQKLKVIELTQINDVGRNTPVTAFASRFAELCLDLGIYRYGK